ALGSNQTPDALAHLQNRFRQRVFDKWIAAARFDNLEPRFHQWVIGHGKGKPSDDDIGKGIARNIDPHPETVGAEKNTSRRGLKLLQQAAARSARTLHEQVEP